MIISVEESKVDVQAYSNCYPTECDWGQVKAEPYLSGILKRAPYNTEALTAIFPSATNQSEGEEKRLMITPGDDATLVVHLTSNNHDKTYDSSHMRVERLKLFGP